MICEKCGKEFSEDYRKDKGAKRRHPTPKYCSIACSHARTFSVEAIALKSKRQKEYLAKHPEALESFKEAGIRASKSPETNKARRDTWIEKYKSRPFNLLGANKKKLYILEEQEGKCNSCKIDQEWNGKFLAFEMDHIDGNRQNNNRENLQVICPNCHSQTETYKTKNSEKKVTDEELRTAFENNSSVYTALLSLGLNPHGTHYQRMYKLLGV